MNFAFQTPPGAQPDRHGGFTLIEVIISSALMSLVLASAYACFNASVASQKALEPRLEVIQNARVAMALLTADLRAACPLDRNFDFLGMHRAIGDAVADNLDFATHNYTPRSAREGDYCQLSYYLNHDPETGELTLWRRRNPTIALDPLSGGSREEIATGVLGFRLEYYDGFDWYDTWGDLEGTGKTSSRSSQGSQNQPGGQNTAATIPNLTGMPQAVRITLWLDSNPHRKPPPGAGAERRDPEKREPPMVFQTVARLNVISSLASTSAADSSSSSDSSNSGGDTSQTGGTGGRN